MMRALAPIFVVAALAAGCETLKPYEKEYLLHPLMDDAMVSSLEPSLASSVAGENEKLAGGASAGGATSCPTCGG